MILADEVNQCRVWNENPTPNATYTKLVQRDQCIHGPEADAQHRSSFNLGVKQLRRGLRGLLSSVELVLHGISLSVVGMGRRLQKKSKCIRRGRTF
jgi:hypothetical protein